MLSRARGPRVDASSAWWLWTVGVGAFAIVYYLVPPWVSGWMLLAANLASGAAVLLAVRMWAPAHPLPWQLIGTGLLTYGTGNAVWFSYNLLLDAGSSVISLANLFYAAGYGLVAAGLVLALRRRDAAGFSARLLDGLIVITGSAAWWWTVLIQPIATSPSIDFFERVTSAAYPVSDLALLTMFGAFIIAPVRASFSDKLVIAAVGSALVADFIYSGQALSNSYEVGGLVDLPWLIGFAFFGAAALHPSMIEALGPAPQTQPMGRRRVGLFVVASLVGPLTLAARTLNGYPVSMAVLVGSSVLLFILVVTRMAGLLRNVEEQMQELDAQGQALAEAEERFRTLAEQIPAVTYIGSREPYVPSIYISPRLEGLLGFTPAEWLLDSNNWRNRLHPDDATETIEALARANTEGADFCLEYRMSRRDGALVWVRDEAVLLHDAEGRPTLWQGQITDITEHKRLEAQLTHQAFHDPLTKLPNRALFSDRVDHAVRRIERTEECVAVMFIDLDNFKVVNDTLGHAVGDEVLSLTAKRLNESLRGADTAARLGGDEFAVLLEATSEIDARRIATRILSSFRRELRVHDKEVMLAGSIGIAMGSGAEDSDQLLRNADTAMYAAKNGGRNRFVMFEQSMRSNLVTRRALQDDLKQAVENGELTVHYQPIFQLERMEMIGVEALVRWDHPERGPISPADFIPLAEEDGLIVPLGQFVLDTACAQARAWELALPREHPLTMGVNFSVRQLQLPRFTSDVIATLDRHSLNPDRLVLEITETVFMSDPEDIAHRLRLLADSGVPLAIDDFGAGYSSLGYLRDLPARVLKIDRGFVRGIDSGGSEHAFAEAITTLGRHLGLDVVAEGIETTGELEAMRRFGCNYGQGFLMCRPLPVGELERWMESSSRPALETLADRPQPALSGGPSNR